MDGREKRGTQLLKGVLDLCLLALIDETPRYGYEIVRKLEERGLGLAAEGSIYPVLARLQKGGHVEGYPVPSAEGPARKYYRLLPAGRRHLDDGRAEWRSFADAVERVLAGGNGDERDTGDTVDAGVGARPGSRSGDANG